MTRCSVVTFAISFSSRWEKRRKGTGTQSEGAPRRCIGRKKKMSDGESGVWQSECALNVDGGR